MKKSIIMFAIFFIIDIILIAVLSNFNDGRDYVYIFLAAIFIEIAIFGSFIIYEISKLYEMNKQGEKKDD